MTPTAAPELMLAMDTTGDVCSVAVFRAGRLHAELAFRHEMHLSERLISHVDFLLGQIGATLAEVGVFAVGIGPGSFTGTRIGVMTVKTFAFLRDRPVVGINGLEAMAAEYCGTPDLLVAPVLPCRSGVVYAAAFAVSGPAPEVLLEPDAYTFAQLGEAIQCQAPRAVLFCGPAAVKYEMELRACTGDFDCRAEIGVVEFPRASAVGRLALGRLRSGAALPSALELTPLYISPPPITMPKQPIPT